MSDIYISLDDAIKAVNDIPVPYDSYYANITNAGKELVISTLKTVNSHELFEKTANASKENSVDEFICEKCGIRLDGYRKAIVDEDGVVQCRTEYEPKFCPECGRFIKDR